MSVLSSNCRGFFFVWKIAFFQICKKSLGRPPEWARVVEVAHSGWSLVQSLGLTPQKKFFDKGFFNRNLVFWQNINCFGWILFFEELSRLTVCQTDPVSATSFWHNYSWNNYLLYFWWLGGKITVPYTKMSFPGKLYYIYYNELYCYTYFL